MITDRSAAQRKFLLLPQQPAACYLTIHTTFYVPRWHDLKNRGRKASWYRKQESQLMTMKEKLGGGGESAAFYSNT